MDFPITNLDVKKEYANYKIVAFWDNYTASHYASKILTITTVFQYIPTFVPPCWYIFGIFTGFGYFCCDCTIILIKNLLL